MAAPGSQAELNARQRKHVHMHSTIFSAEGPTTKSVYAPARQQELYQSVKGALRENNSQAPEIRMPSAADVKCTQLAGCDAVIGGRQQERPTAGSRPATAGGPSPRTTPQESRAVVRAGEKDPSFIPKEFWQTSVNLQWHDTRNEQCRQRGQGAGRQGISAQDARRHEMSSEIFGTSRATDASTGDARGELLAETADHLAMDSTLFGRKDESAHHKQRMQANLTNSQHSTLARREPAQAPERVVDEDPQGRDRRRKEKNFSDMFGAKMGDRKETRGNREEILGASNCSFLDPRGEIAAKNKEHWRQSEDRPANARKQDERNSQLFNFQCPDRPRTSPQQQEDAQDERACWDTRHTLQASSEIARRQRTRDHCPKDAADEAPSYASPTKSSRQGRMSSDQVRRQMQPNEPRPAPNMGPTPRLLGGAARADPGTPFEREQMLQSARETKIASLQSSIF